MTLSKQTTRKIQDCNHSHFKFHSHKGRSIFRGYQHRSIVLTEWSKARSDRSKQQVNDKVEITNKNDTGSIQLLSVGKAVCVSLPRIDNEMIKASFKSTSSIKSAAQWGIQKLSLICCNKTRIVS